MRYRLRDYLIMLICSIFVVYLALYILVVIIFY